MKLSTRSALTFLLWLATLSTLAIGMATNIRETTVDGFFPLAILGFLLGWVGEIFARHSRSAFFRALSAWLILLFLGSVFAFIHNGRLAGPLLAMTGEAARYHVQRIESRVTRVAPDPADLQAAQTQWTSRFEEVSRRVSIWMEKARRGDKDEDALARQIVWSLPAYALAAWAGWTLRRRGRALPAILPSTGLLAYLQYYSEPDPLVFQLHLLIALMLAALTEGSAPLRAHPTRGLSGDALTATFLACAGIIVIAGFAPSVSAKAIQEALETRARAEQNERAAQALGLQPAESAAPNRYAQPGLPREHLLQGAPQLSRLLVFTVRTGDLPPMPRVPRDERPPRYYWRTITYDTYTGRGWAVTLNESRDEEASQLLIDTIPTGYRLLDFDLTLLSASPLPWTGQLIRANQPLRTIWRTLPNSRSRSLDPLRGADLIAAASDATAFHVESILPEFSVAQLRASSVNYPDWVRDQYLALPANLPARVRDLARDLTSNQPTAYDRALAIESYLRRFPYTLDIPVPPADRDVADYFLFDLQTGYCDYYATAMVVLARAAGLPARLVSGYASGEYIPTEAVYRVRESDAHSWVEIYFVDIGWVEFEPTANRPRIERATGEVSATEDTPLPEVAPAARSRFAIALQNLAALSRRSWLTGILSFVLILFIAITIRDRLRQNAPVRTIIGIYKQVYRLGRPLLEGTRRALTPSAFARVLEKRLSRLPRSKFLRDFLAPAAAELTALTDLYVRAIYSPVSPTREETIRAMQIWRKLFWRLWVMRIGIQNFEFRISNSRTPTPTG